ncbi:KEOPS complex subunit Pcc1 [Halobellus rufus]|uniref:KEOPS complex subunit Pcc1 n=1 Tax=Halobellus rufus TaxID=1448860 RepID=UPI0006790187|nr:KEOPS complex subunit Pcc1 [Halobellus rufus]
MASRETPAVDAAHAAEFHFTYCTESTARTIFESVRVEVGEIADERSGADVTREGRVVTVRVEAADLVALRAAQNTWIRLVEVAEDVAATGQTS